MKSIKKTEFAQSLSEKLEITKKQANDFMEAFVEGVTMIMKAGNKLNVPGLGIFKVADRPARMGRNPQTGAPLHIPASKTPAFKAGKGLKDSVK